MSFQARNGILVFVAIIVLLLIYKKVVRDDCKARISYENININDCIDLDSLFRPIEPGDVSDQLVAWKSFDVRSDSSKIVRNINVSGRKGVLVEHYHNGDKHFGAVFLPFHYDKFEKYPLLIWANGLDQFNPTVSIDSRDEIRQLLSKLDGYFLVIPSFRGQSLEVNQRRYCSDGFFGDAFDGATDDVLRLLRLAQLQFEGIDPLRMAVFGVSRGGTVALLAGIRNNEISCVIAQSAPTDFFGKHYLYRYSKQYKYQFLSKTTDMEEIRRKIIKSSPVYFISEYPNRLFIIHGKHDGTVPILHATKLIERIENGDQMKYERVERGHNFDYVDRVIDWLVKHNDKKNIDVKN